MYLCLAAFFGLLVADSVMYSTYWALYALLVACASFAAFFFRQQRGERKILRVISLFFITIFFFICLGQFTSLLASPPQALYEKSKWEAKVLARSKEDSYAKYTVLLSEGEERYQAYMLTELYPEYAAGSVLAIEDTLDKGETSIVSDDQKKTFDYSSLLLGKGIVGTFFFPKKIEVKGIEDDYHSRAEEKKYEYIESIHKALPAEEAKLTSATLFGAEVLTKEDKEMYRKAGISHIVALSGFNISIIIAFLFVTFFFLPFWLRIALSILCVTLYLSMTGVSGSLLRATIMSAFSLLILLRRGFSTPARILVFAFLTCCIFFPEDVLRDVSLQLSFLAMVGLLFVYPVLWGREGERELFSVKELVKDLFLLTVSVTLVVAPFASFVFGTASLYGVIGSVLVAPFVPIITVLGIVFLIFQTVSPILATVVSFPLSLSAYLVKSIAKGLSELPHNTISFELSAFSLVFYYTLLWIVLIIIQEKRKRKREKPLAEDGSRESPVVERIIHY